MEILQIGLDHKSAPIALREKLLLAASDIPDTLGMLCPHNGRNGSSAQEVAVLSTCNRLELYEVVEDAGRACETALERLAQTTGVTAETLRTHLTLRRDEEAVAHLCEVACGLDSMILGESQIQGQVSEAHEMAMVNGTAGAVINALFRSAVHAGKRARTETAINQYATSISHAAVELASQIFQDLSRKQALLIGAGEMAELAAKNLVDNGVGSLLVVNRSLHRAVDLARQFDGEALEWQRLRQALAQADIVISSTAAPQAIVTPEMTRTAMYLRRNRPLLIIDIAVPRDVDPAVGKLPNVFLYNIDDLQQVVVANLEQRRHEIPRVQAIIQAEVSGFMAWYRALDVVPTIVDLRQQAERIREAEIERALHRLEHLSEQERNVVLALSQRIVNKILHQPTVRLKARANGHQCHEYTEMVRDLFGLDGALIDDSPEEHTDA